MNEPNGHERVKYRPAFNGRTAEQKIRSAIAKLITNVVVAYELRRAEKRYNANIVIRLPTMPTNMMNKADVNANIAAPFGI